MERIKEYLPSIGMVLAAVASVLATAVSDNRLTSDEVANLVLAGLGAFSVYFVPRLPKLTWLKPVIAAVTGALQFAVSIWGDGITMSEWVQIGLTALAALGVIATNGQVPLYMGRRADRAA